MEFDYYSSSETFVVLTADQFVGRDDGLPEQQKQDSYVCRRNGTFHLISSSPTKTTKSKKLRIRNRILSEVRYCRISQYQSVLSFLIYQKFCHTFLAVCCDNLMIYHF